MVFFTKFVKQTWWISAVEVLNCLTIRFTGGICCFSHKAVVSKGPFLRLLQLLRAAHDGHDLWKIHFFDVIRLDGSVFWVQMAHDSLDEKAIFVVQGA